MAVDLLTNWYFTFDDGCEGDLGKWEENQLLYISLMSKADAEYYTNICELTRQPNCCKKHILAWCKEVGDRAKKSGTRAGVQYILLLDLYSLFGWTQYTQEESNKAAIVFVEGPEEPMFPQQNDECLYESVYSFLSTHCHLDANDNNLDQWLINREWANHGTASDVHYHKPFEHLANDKATLAWSLIPDTLPIDPVLKNEVFPKRDRKERIIVVGPTCEYIIGSYVNAFVMENLVTAPFEIVNSSKVDDWQELIIERVQTQLVNFPVDQSAFDQNQRKAAVLAARDWCIDAVYNATKDDRFLSIKTSGDEIITGNKQLIGEWNSGLLSGKWYTSIVGSLLNAYETWRCNNSSWENIVLPTLHQGDDSQIWLRDTNYAEQIMSNAKELGVKINPNKNFVDVNRTDFLHTMYSAKGQRSILGPHLKNRTVYCQRYPARAMTSICDGDQDNAKISTTQVSQATVISKKIDRLYAALTRLNNLDIDTARALEIKLGLNDLEQEYAGTPTALGGLGAIRTRTQMAAQTGGGHALNLEIVKDTLGYTHALALTEKQLGQELQPLALEAIQGSLKFTKLDTEASNKLKIGYYNLARVEYKASYCKNRSTILRDTSNSIEPLQAPVPKVVPYWKLLSQAISKIPANWNEKSRQTYAQLSRAGNFVRRQWVEGKLKITIAYSDILDKEHCAKYSEHVTKLLLLYLTNHRGSDVTPVQLKCIKMELEHHAHLMIREQSRLYFTF